MNRLYAGTTGNPLIILNTTNNGTSTFDPEITKSGSTVSWDLGNGVQKLNQNSFSYSGYTSSAVKTIKVFNVDNFNSITLINIRSDSLVGGLFSLDKLINLSTFSCSSNQLTGSIPSLSNNVNLSTFYCYSNQLTGYSGGLSSCVKLTVFSAENNLLTQTAVSDIIDDLFIIRSQIGALSCAINVDGTGNASPDADAIAKIEGTGAYLGDGLKDSGCTVLYN